MDKYYIADFLARTRVDANKAQNHMAKSLGVSLNTVKNWETGITVPNIINLVDWFKALHIDPARHIIQMVQPDAYKPIEYSDINYKNALINYLNNFATDKECQLLYYCIFGKTGSSWYSQLNMLAALNHCSLRTKVIVAWTVYNAYTMEKALGTLQSPNEAMPDEDNFVNAIRKGHESAALGFNEYINIKES